MSDTAIDTRVGPPALDGDHERFTHIVKDKAKLTESIVTGAPMTALCGKVWVPGRDPQRFPVCETCKEQFERITGRPWT